ncbi:Os06g0280900 [Oryza sativa Japonica Group]|uniref:Os06g0280900 protein n=1 Tax=Oryza sativa subsp. japonica TaxID=39947 RepID=B9FSR4_ORYSJ|nr:hypothetical protein OsJ_20974 [Oryza sativa Japonica Group]KAF2926290.1 hypothetical protein DAI22_06g115600 [Oryza sativa Japonica Group]BAD69122.1 unknown protein [Oryza sativa Japonica Group]BAD69186.1 unknown protein [Oryza sativa Japonica Group]BAH93441.1 Os06g0280900 [Oryza sativa Japonica Group]|eukprot:NP_001174713.1 Os06g0280900 [Oryza sativa Japonica Group]
MNSLLLVTSAVARLNSLAKLLWNQDSTKPQRRSSKHEQARLSSAQADKLEHDGRRDGRAR